MRQIYHFSFLFILILLVPVSSIYAQSSPPIISSISDSGQTGTYEKFEATYQIQTIADNMQLPYDPNPPAGLDRSYPKHNGISVDALFLPPGKTDWNTEGYKQPAFYYQSFETGQHMLSGKLRDWQYPLDQFAWKVRFSPHVEGTWQYKLTATDEGGTTTEQTIHSFTVVPSTSHGFLKVSQTDPRYFAFDDGTYFTGLGFQSGLSLDDPILKNAPTFQKYKQDGINFFRAWMSSMYGSAWLTYQGTRNLYDGYLPRIGLLPAHDPDTGTNVFTYRLDFDEDASGNLNIGWFDACMHMKWDDRESVKPDTTYRLRVKYQAENMVGPRDPAFSDYGFVVKKTGIRDTCYNHEVTTPNSYITDYGHTTDGNWGYIEGTWTSGPNDYFFPDMFFVLENVLPSQDVNLKPKVSIHDISLKENLGNGQYGHELMIVDSMDLNLGITQHYSFALDQALELAEQNDVYMKWVLMDKGDVIYSKLDDDGTFVGELPDGTWGNESDNLDGFYGLGRTENKTRWLQQAWWRYLTARWGYSTAIHSWEVTNEGDPFNTTHYQMTDEMGKFFHCEVFGASVGAGDNQQCTYDHPNDHLVTTSFWHSYPGYSTQTGNGFWGNPKYPNVDYGDVHAYISTSQEATCQEKYAMQFDAALYHILHSARYGGWIFPGGKIPVVRGEAGMDGFVEGPTGCTITTLGGQQKTGTFPQSQNNLGIAQDTGGVWLHNYIWAQADSYGLYDLYWWVGEHMTPGGNDNLVQFKPFSDFIKTVPLNNGNYVDIGATVSNTNLRVVGQKDLTNGNAHLWVQNKNHTWRNVLCAGGTLSAAYQTQYECGQPGTQLTTESGTVSIDGFESNIAYTLETWDISTNPAQQSVTTSAITSDSQGTIAIAVSNLSKDVAYKIVNPAAPTPTGGVITPTGVQISGDTDQDGDVDIFDYNAVITDFGKTGGQGFSVADFDDDGDVDIFDYNVVISNFGR